MSERLTNTPADSSATSPRFLPLLLVLFFGSGCAALIYEIVWFQLLQLVIGSSAVSLGVLLGTYMGGMCLGSLLLPRLISSRRNPLAVYAALELGIGIIGILVLYAVPLVGRIYSAHVGHGFAGILLRGIVGAVCLLPPTLLMGATLPAVSRWVETTPKGVSWLGFFYGGNIAGAVFGCLFAGFYLLRVYDMATATYVAVMINGAVAVIGFGLATLTSHRIPTSLVRPDRVDRGPGVRAVYVTIALSGLCALGAEVVWTRLLSLLLGGTVYTFSIILAVFLFGLGIGSSIGSFLARGGIQPRLALALCQMLLAATIAWTAYALACSLPYWPIDPSLSKDPWFNFQIDLVRCLWAILPATLLWGASFPLALAAAASPGQDPGRLVGGIYSANTVGAIVGALAFSMILIPWAGTQQSQRLLIGLSTLAALVMMGSLLVPLRAGGPGGITPRERWLRIADAVAVGAALIGIAGLLAWSVPQVPGALVAYGRFMPGRASESKILYMGEGMNSSVAVSQIFSSGVRNFHVSGKVEASTEPQDMRLQRMLGHLPALLHPKPRSVLIVGCGAGVTAGSFTLHPDIQRIVICELEPLIPRVVATYFAAENCGVLQDPRVEVVYDDARHYILTTHEKFDIITSDPIHPWVKGSATLYTKEYFELVKRHLNPGGVVTQWVPLYESTVDVVKSELATFFAAFPEGTMWSNDESGKGYDVVLFGQAGPTKISVDELEERLRRADHQRVAASLEEVGFKSVIGLLSTYAGQAVDLQPWLRNAQLNRDRNLRLQYLAGLGLNLYQSEAILNDMLVYRRFPEDLFVGSEQTRHALRTALETRNPGF